GVVGRQRRAHPDHFRGERLDRRRLRRRAARTSGPRSAPAVDDGEAEGDSQMTSNLPLKLLSVFLAFVVWFAVSAPRREPVSERAFAAPVSLVRMPRDLAITTPVPDTVSVRLRGRVSDLRSLSSQNLEVTVDLSWVTPGEASITLRPQAIAVPPQIDVISIEPTKVHFRVDQIRQKV